MRSDAVRKGMQQAPHRSLFNALGMTEEEMNKPLVGIVSSYNEIVPGHMNLDKIVEAVKLGVAMGGGERQTGRVRAGQVWLLQDSGTVDLRAEPGDSGHGECVCTAVPYDG